MQKISFIFQILFKVLLIFFLVFVWVRYFVRSLPLCIIISLAATIVIDLATRFFSRKKSNSIMLKKEKREEAENIFLSLSISPKALDFFLLLAQKKHNAEKKKDFVLISHDGGEKVVLWPFLSHNELMPNDIANIFYKTKSVCPDKIVIACGAFSPQAASFAKNFDCEFLLLDKYDCLQKLYIPYDIKPEITMQYKKEKALSFKELVKFSVNRSRAKGYFLSALALLISTFFVRATIYYCIVSSLLVALALVSLYSPFERTKPKGEIL